MSDTSGLSRSEQRHARALPVHEAFERNYAQVQYQFVQFLTEHLADCARAFSGDLSKVLVLAVLGQRHIEAHLSVQAGQAPALPGTMSASRIADVTGLPRETVRRKLDALAAQGWVEKGPDRRWQITRTGGELPVRDALKDLDSRGLQRLARLYANLSPLAG